MIHRRLPTSRWPTFRWPAFAWLAEGLVLLALIGGGFALAGVPLSALNPHPYGLAVLLMALQHGTIRAAVVMVGATLLLLAGLPGQEFGQPWNAYLLGLVREPLLWCAGVLIVGGLTDRLRRRRDAAEAQTTQAQAQLTRIIEANEALSASHRALEASVASQAATASRIFEATRALGQTEASIIAGAPGLLRAMTAATSVALYLVNGGRVLLAAAEGDNDARDTELGLEWITALAAGRECLVASRAEDRRILAGRALLAGPLLSPEGTLLGVLTVEVLPFRSFGIDTVSNFLAVCGWVGAALAVERALSQAEDARFGTEGCRFIGPSSSEPAAHFMMAIAERLQLDLTSIDIGLPPDRMADVPMMIAEMQAVFRNADMLLQARRDGSVLHALLLGTDAAGGWQAEARLRAAIAQHDTGLAAALGTNVSTLYLPQRRAA